MTGGLQQSTSGILYTICLGFLLVEVYKQMQITFIKSLHLPFVAQFSLYVEGKAVPFRKSWH